MADPISIAGLGATGAGALVSALGAGYQGNAQAAMYNYQAGVARTNAILAKQDAEYSRSVGEVEAQESGMKTGAQVATTKAIQGASNVDVNTGSSSLVRASETEIGQFEQSVIRSNAAKRAFGFDVQAAKDTAQAGAYDVAASTSRTSGTLGIISSLIGGASQVSSKWLTGKNQGLWGGAATANVGGGTD